MRESYRLEIPLDAETHTLGPSSARLDLIDVVGAKVTHAMLCYVIIVSSVPVCVKTGKSRTNIAYVTLVLSMTLTTYLCISASVQRTVSL